MVFSEITAHLGRVNRYNLETLRRSPAAEISGALGDLGTLLPLMIALTIRGSIDLPSTLVFSGVFNVVTGASFGIPLPVQPMKAIAAAAIAREASLRETTAAGGLVGAAVLLLSITGLIRWLTSHVPVPVVKGIQLGAGLQLIISAGSSLILPLDWFSPLLDNRTWSLMAFLALLTITPPGTSAPSLRSGKTPPYALVVFFVGLFFSLLSIVAIGPIGSSVSSSGPRLPFFSLWHPFISVPAFLSPSSIGMAISQLPLTTLNSIIAVCALAEDLFPPETLPLTTATPTPNTPYPSPPSTTSLGVSISLMNLVGCFFGCMPVCHGSGGLAAQYRFGARSGSSVILLGSFKIITGLFLGKSLLDLLASFPKSILGIMVAAAALELARAGTVLNYGAADLYVWEDVGAGEQWGSGEGRRSVQAGGSGQQPTRQKRHRILSEAERDERWKVMLMTTGGILAFKNDAVGFIAGLLCHAAYRLAEPGSRADELGEGEEAAGRTTSGRRRRGYGVSISGRRYQLSRRRYRPRQATAEESPLLASD